MWLNSISHEAMLQSSDSLLAAILGISVCRLTARAKRETTKNKILET